MVTLRFYQMICDDPLTAVFSPGILMDNKTRAHNSARHGTDALCKYCAGGGNEIFYHYKCCTRCGGTGIARKAEK